jgi:hypothetical protein
MFATAFDYLNLPLLKKRFIQDFFPEKKRKIFKIIENNQHTMFFGSKSFFLIEFPSLYFHRFSFKLKDSLES